MCRRSAETVPGYEASAWFGIGAPKGTPADIIEKLNKTVNAALADPKMKARLAELGGIPMRGTPAEFGKVMADETGEMGEGRQVLRRVDRLGRAATPTQASSPADLGSTWRSSTTCDRKRGIDTRERSRA